MTPLLVVCAGEKNS